MRCAMFLIQLERERKVGEMKEERKEERKEGESKAVIKQFTHKLLQE